MPPIRVSILGAGMALEHLHFPSIASLPEKFILHSVLERSDKGKAREICEAAGEFRVVRTLEEVIEDQEVELVVVGTPNNTHFDYGRRCLEAGKHVLIEKPICPTVEETLQLISLAKSKNLILSVYQNRRWDSDFLTVKKLLSEGALGDLNEFQSSYDRYRPLPASYKPGDNWKETPGEHNDVIYNLGSHIIDQAFVLFGRPEKVGCRCWDIRGIGLDESFLMDLHYPSLVVTLKASILSPLPHQFRFIIKGSKGSYIKYGEDQQNLKQLGKGLGMKIPNYGEEDPKNYGTLYLSSLSGRFEEIQYKSERGNYPALYENVYEAISSGNSELLEVKPEQAAWVLMLIELGIQSSKEGRSVDVPQRLS